MTKSRGAQECRHRNVFAQVRRGKACSEQAFYIKIDQNTYRLARVSGCGLYLFSWMKWHDEGFMAQTRPGTHNFPPQTAFTATYYTLTISYYAVSHYGPLFSIFFSRRDFRQRRVQFDSQMYWVQRLELLSDCQSTRSQVPFGPGERARPRLGHKTFAMLLHPVKPGG